MSSKLVKQQLSNLLEQSTGIAAPESKKADKAAKRNRQKKVQKKTKVLLQKAREVQAAKRVFKDNLKYYKNTKESSALNQQLMQVSVMAYPALVMDAGHG